MSRTVHHVPPCHRSLNVPWYSVRSGPLTGHTLTTLRYTSATGRLPKQLMRSFAAYTYPRALVTPVTDWGEYEPSARASLQRFRVRARKELYAASLDGGGTDALLDVAEELDHPPTRHLHRNLWEC